MALLPASPVEAELRELMRTRIAVFDGGAGTFFQSLGLVEDDYRAGDLASHPCPLKGNNDLLNITKPDAIRALHKGYLDNGADIIETNTFCSNRISQADYGLERLVHDLNAAGARIAREEATRAQEADPQHRRRFVAGSMGPTNKSASTSTDVNHPEARPITFDDLVEVYTEQARGLVEGGVDIMLIETIFDTINCKAAIAAIHDVFEEVGRRLPIWISVTMSDKSARTLSGQTAEAFWVSVSHCKPLCFGFNCSLGVVEMAKFVRSLSPLVTCHLAIYPNAGIPNEMGLYPDTPAEMAEAIGQLAREGFINVVGGCCGTRKDHIAAIAKAVAGDDHLLRVSGLEHTIISSTRNFVNIGEQCNVAGSRMFLNKIKDGKFEEAVSIARAQVDAGAQMLDVNMDDSMIDAADSITKFLNFLGSDPYIAKVPLVIDSSKLDVIKAGLSCAQGKCVVNSISLKEGEEKFLKSAKLCRRYGAAVIVMAFDEEGQAVTVEHKVRVCTRAYNLLVTKAGVPPQDIIFDLNVLMICSGMHEHNTYAMNFIEATRIIKETMPLTHISGGVSNLSFAFRSNAYLRQAMHSVFLYHTIKAGMEMALVNAARLLVYDQIPQELRKHVEEAILNVDEEASDRLIEYARTMPTPDGKAARPVAHVSALASLPPVERLRARVIEGNIDGLAGDIEETLKEGRTALSLIEGPLMAGMTEVGEQFGAGKMFLPQVLKAARVMREAVNVLSPLLKNSSGQSSSRGKMVFATVKGDVHDIGKNICGIALSCNGIDVVDIGTMCPAETIADAIEREHAELVGVSGLITPSLDEMAIFLRELERRRITIPVLVGGATTSHLHTALKLAPLYSGPVIHTSDASRIVVICLMLLDPETREDYVREYRKGQEETREHYYATNKNLRLLSLAEARKRAPKYAWAQYAAPVPSKLGVTVFDDYPMDRLISRIDWNSFFALYRVLGSGKTRMYPRIFEDEAVGKVAKGLFSEAQQMLKEIVEKKQLTARGVVGIFPANSINEDVELYEDDTREKVLCTLPFLRQQIDKPNAEPNYSASDFVAPKGTRDYVALWALTSGIGLEGMVAQYKAEGKVDQQIMIEALAMRLAEAFAECAQEDVRQIIAGQTIDTPAADRIRHAIGYPSMPDHSLKQTLWKLIDPKARAGIELTDSHVMRPVTSVSGIEFAAPHAKYFAIGRIGQDQLESYAARQGLSVEQVSKELASVLSH
eukprot:m51a1_g14704 putative methionine synthase (1220) ;mRNA; r:131738-137219